MTSYKIQSLLLLFILFCLMMGTFCIGYIVRAKQEVKIYQKQWEILKPVPTPIEYEPANANHVYV